MSYSYISTRFTQWIERHPARAASLASWSLQGVNIVANVLLVPLILNLYGKEVAGVWFFMLSWMAFFQLCDFGISQSTGRQIAFSMGDKKGDVHVSNSKFARIYGKEACYQVFLSSIDMFRVIVIAIVVLAIFAERTFLFKGRMSVTPDIHLTWYLVILAGTGYIMARPYQAFLEGLLLPSWSRISTLLAMTIEKTLFLLALILRTPIWAVGLMLCMGGWSQYLIARVFLTRRFHLQRPGQTGLSRSIFRALWSLSWQQGIATTAAFLIFSINPILVGYFLGKEIVPDYYLPWKISTVLLIGLFGLFEPQLTFMINLLREGRIQDLLIKTTRLFIITAACTLFVFSVYVLFGERIIWFWSTGKVKAGTIVLTVFALYQALAVIQTFCAIFIVVHGTQPFAKIATAGALLNILFVIMLTPRYGVLGMALSTALAQLLTSNWYIPYRFLKLWKTHLNSLQDHCSFRQIIFASLKAHHILLLK